MMDRHAHNRLVGDASVEKDVQNSARNGQGSYRVVKGACSNQFTIEHIQNKNGFFTECDDESAFQPGVECGELPGACVLDSAGRNGGDGNCRKVVIAQNLLESHRTLNLHKEHNVAAIFELQILMKMTITTIACS